MKVRVVLVLITCLCWTVHGNDQQSAGQSSSPSERSPTRGEQAPGFGLPRQPGFGAPRPPGFGPGFRQPGFGLQPAIEGQVPGIGKKIVE